VLFALGTPVAFVALLAAFLLALCLRAIAIRLTARSLGLADRHESIWPRLREDVDPFGAVGVAIGGVGWGKMLSVDDIPRYRGRFRPAMVFLAGPLVNIVLGEILVGVYAVAFPGSIASYVSPGSVLLGIGGLPTAEVVVLSLGIGLLSFGVLGLIPIPPLDGFGIMYNALRRPGASIQWMRLWFEEKNIGVVILVACCLVPLPGPILLHVVDALDSLFLIWWG
jgi:Zn-dependent protease